MEVSVMQREPMIVVGWKRKFISILASEEGSSNAIGDLWMDVFKHDVVSKLPGSLGHPTWGVIWADDPAQRSHPAELNYLAGVPFSSVPELPEGMSSYNVPGGTFAIVTHRGPLSGLKETIGFIHRWVDENGYAEPADWCDLELYDERFFKEGPDQALDYFINIVPAAANQPAPNVTIEQAPDKGSEDTGSRSHEFKRRTDKLRMSRETKPAGKAKTGARSASDGKARTKPKKAPKKKKAEVRTSSRTKRTAGAAKRSRGGTAKPAASKKKAANKPGKKKTARKPAKSAPRKRSGKTKPKKHPGRRRK